MSLASCSWLVWQQLGNAVWMSAGRSDGWSGRTGRQLKRWAGCKCAEYRPALAWLNYHYQPSQLNMTTRIIIYKKTRTYLVTARGRMGNVCGGFVRGDCPWECPDPHAIFKLVRWHVLLCCCVSHYLPCCTVPVLMHCSRLMSDNKRFTYLLTYLLTVFNALCRLLLCICMSYLMLFGFTTTIE